MMLQHNACQFKYRTSRHPCSTLMRRSQSSEGPTVTVVVCVALAIRQVTMSVSSSSPKLASSASATPLTAAKRLLWDLQDLAASPLEYVSAAPVSDRNLLEWHANLVGPADFDVPSLRNVPWHFVLYFPQDYPARPPTVVLSTPIEGHPNVVRAHVTLGQGKDTRREHVWTVCMDMFDLPASTSDPF